MMLKTSMLRFFCKKYLAILENVRTFASDFEREISCGAAAPTPQMPHSSSGPGHLPLTQKITSSTLVCGTNEEPPKKGRLSCFSDDFFFRCFPLCGYSPTRKTVLRLWRFSFSRSFCHCLAVRVRTVWVGRVRSQATQTDVSGCSTVHSASSSWLLR